MAQNFLEVKLVFWRYKTTTILDRDEMERKINSAITALCNDNAREWRYGGMDVFTGADGETKLCVTIQHNDYKGDNVLVETAVESLCQVLFLKKSVLALDPVLADGKFLMGPFSETSMIATDRMFGRNFARENLAQLQRTGGLGATMQETMRQSDKFMNRNATKWFHAPLYAGLCVTNMFTFFDSVFEGFDTQDLDKLDNLCDKDMKAILEKGKYVLQLTKMFSQWGPTAEKKMQAQLVKLNQSDKKAVLKSKAISLMTGKKELEVLVRNLGERDPDVTESQQIVGSLSGMMTACAPLYNAISDYTDTCVARVVMGSLFAGAGIILATSTVLLPPVGMLAGMAAFSGSVVGGGMLGGFGVATIVDGIDLHNAKQFKWAVRTIYTALMSCRLFLLLILINTQGCLDPTSGYYQEFRAAINKQCKADVDRFNQPMYINQAVKRLVTIINSGVTDLEKDLEKL